VLPHSNWEWAMVCRSESLSALRRGVQAAVFRLGRVPECPLLTPATPGVPRVWCGVPQHLDARTPVAEVPQVPREVRRAAEIVAAQKYGPLAD